MTFGAIAAEIAASYFRGRECEEMRLFSLRRPGAMRGASP
jgi:hypothetical protein